MRKHNTILVKLQKLNLSDSRTYRLTFKEVLLIDSTAVYVVKESIRTHYRKRDQAKVLRDEIIELEYHPEDENGKQNLKVKNTLQLRKVSYQDEQNYDN